MRTILLLLVPNERYLMFTAEANDEQVNDLG